MNTRKFSVGNHGDPEPQPPIQRPVESALYFGSNPNSAPYVPSIASNAQPQQHAALQQQPQSNNATNKMIESMNGFLQQREDKRRYLNQKLNELERSRSGKRQALVGCLTQVQREYQHAIFQYRQLRKRELKHVRQFADQWHQLLANHNLDEIANQREISQVIQEMHMLDESQYCMHGRSSFLCNICNVNFNRRNNDGDNGGNNNGGCVY